MAFAYSDIDFPVGSVNPSGVNEIFFIPKADITSWPTIANPEDTAATAATVIKYTGDFTLASGKQFFRLYSTQGKAKLSFEQVGEVDMKMFNNKGSFVFPKLTPNMMALVKAACNGDFVFIGKHNGAYYVIGNKDYRTEATLSGDTGDAAGSAKGVTLEVVCPDITPLPQYVGDLKVTGGTIDCENGSFTAASSGSGSGN